MRRMVTRVLRFIAIISLATAATAASPAFAASDPVGAVYTQTNAAAGNAVLAFDRASDGSLTPAGSYPTGDLGTGTGSVHRVPSRSARTAVGSSSSTRAATTSPSTR